MESIVIVVHVLASIGIIGLVLIQHGKGADMGASFGSGASQTIFGSVGSGNALTKSTTWLATAFFITSLVLALFAKQQAGQSIQGDPLIQNPDQLETVVPVQQDIPAVPGGNAGGSDIPQAPAADGTAAANEAPAANEQAAPESAAGETDIQTTSAAEAASETNPEALETEAEGAGDDSANAPGNE